DPEPMRDRLRSIPYPAPPETQEELRRLASSIDVRAHHPATLIRLTHTLQDVGLRDLAIRILRDAQAFYPGDYWFNRQLSFALGDVHPREASDGAIRYMTAAVAVRPSTAGIHADWLARNLRARGEGDQAIALYRRAIAAEPEEAGVYWSAIASIL